MKTTPLTVFFSMTLGFSTSQAANQFVQILDPDAYSSFLSVGGEDTPPITPNTYIVPNDLSSLDISTSFAYNASFGGFYSTGTTSVGAELLTTASSITDNNSAARISQGIDVTNLNRVEAKLSGNYKLNTQNGNANVSLGFVSLAVEYTDGSAVDAIGYFDLHNTDIRGVYYVINNGQVEQTRSQNVLNERSMYFNIPADKHGTVKDVWLRSSGRDGYSHSRIGIKDIVLHTGDVSTAPAPAGTPTYLEWHADRVDSLLFADSTHFDIHTATGTVTPSSYSAGAAIAQTTAELSAVNGEYHTSLNLKPDYSSLVRIEAEITGDYRNNRLGSIAVLVEYTDDTVVTAFAYLDVWYNDTGAVVYNNAIQTHASGSSPIFTDEMFYYDIPVEKQGMVRDVYIYGTYRSGYAKSVVEMNNLRFFLDEMDN